ncbi:hypothetical protein SEA_MARCOLIUSPRIME_27 [Mycobacterium phage Marcoliusprime]|uniref:head protein n=1 Tax=Mycobacterium phage Milly TaxID=1567473 RepID=UPI000572A886|nr:head protein [Mycobacterium phage Milly]AJA43700.1 hypothetical protein MILLY_27 [Mycobacterium phage Milly]AOZ64366.1 hypothetical protein SEA_MARCOLIUSPRIME_27 [Mycobacterium phage Marcoliusprime]ASR86571.1 hypothetical protein SEA_DISMALFUNK_27 [Mycobacterium phage DismalFunk]AYB68982.1 hypothetical protein SEA_DISMALSTRESSOR_27 [Mycobacterium phage DismalStressor]
MAATDAFKLAIANAIGAQGAVISLHSADPGKTGANEINGGGYAQKTTVWGAAVIVSGGADDGKARITGSTLQFNVPGGVAITHYGVRSAGGTFLYGKPLAPGATLNGNGVIDVTPTHTYDLT